MYIIAIGCLCALAIIQESGSTCKLPKFVTRCKRGDPNLDKCWRSILEEAPRHLTNGIAECHIPPIDPWRNELAVTITDTLYMSHTYVEHSGTKRFVVINNTISADITRITLKLRFPKLHHACTMLGNGTFLNFTISGEEGCNEAISDVTISFDFQGHKIVKKGKDYVAFNNVTAVAEGKYVNQTFYNIMAGPSEDEKLRYQVLKQPDLFTPFYNGVIEQTIARDIVDIIQRLYSKYSLDTIHPLN